MTRTIKSVTNACELIECLQRYNESTVTELAEETGLTPGTVHTHLTTLREKNYVMKEGTSYRLGPKLLILGEHVRNHASIYRAAKEEVDKLAEETGEIAHLIIEKDGQLFAIYEQYGENSVAVEYHTRKREQALHHLHCTAAGKAILSQFSESRIREIIESHGMSQNTSHTITDIDELLEDLEQVRQRGYAFVDEEQMTGIRAVGAPISISEYNMTGAIAVSGPTARLKNQMFREDLPEKVTEVANICEINLQTLKEQTTTNP